jgi:uncharacterized cupin superfamily protein
MTTKPPSTVVSGSVTRKTGSGYPPPHNEQVKGRAKVMLGNMFGLDQFGVNVVTLAPGAWSSHRHWHEGEDEFIYVLEGQLVLGDDAGDHVLTPGMCAGFKAGSGNGHHLKNLSENSATYLEVGTRLPNDKAHYSDINMMAIKENGAFRFVKRDGSAF